MKLDSKYFDKIRVKPDRDRTAQAEGPRCEWSGCEKPATHPAPKGRGREGEYHKFCFDHVRQYNASYNYFKDMKDTEFVQYQREALHGHRPTWKVGQNAWSARTRENWTQFRRGRNGFNPKADFYDPHEIFGEARASYEPQGFRRQLRNAERKALDALGLDETATADTIKAQFKRLVKLHHPDTNGGNRDGEDKLRAVINAYNYLKSAGFC
jgi:hypothetical protein